MDPIQLSETGESATDSAEYNSKPWEKGVNMINCNKQRDLFFERYESINLRVLIGFWMKEGYLGLVHSAERTYSKGHALLLKLVNEQKVLQYSDVSEERVELSDNSISSCCRHQGFCVTEGLGLFDSVDLGRIGLVELKDGMPMKKTKRGSDSVDVTKGNYESRYKELKYTACSNPRPDTLKPLLVNIEEPSELLLRGCELVLEADFPFEKFKRLSVLEISGLSRVPFSLQNAISQMYQLKTLKLSSLPFNRLGIDFSPFRELHELVLIGFSYLESECLDSISELRRLQCLHLSDLLIDELPENLFKKLLQLRWVTLTRCSKLRILPSVQNLRYLEMLDVSYSSELEVSESAFFSNPFLQMLDFSYTSVRILPTTQGTDHLTHMIARGVNVFESSCLRQVNSIEVLDLSGAEKLEAIWQLEGNKKLTVLNLSNTSISSVDFLPSLVYLRELILSQCIEIINLSSVGNLTKLEVFDIWGCESLRELPEGLNELESLKELNLSYTGVSYLPSFAKLTNLVKLSLRGVELDSLEGLETLSKLKILDLNRLRISPPQELKFDFLCNLEKLEILDLSYTLVARLPDISKLVNLKELLLEYCKNLQLLPDLQTLTNLEVLDISFPVYGCFPTVLSVQSFSAPTNLKVLLLNNHPGVLNLFPLTSLASLEYLDIHGNDEIDFVREHSSKMENLLEVAGWNSGIYGENIEGRSPKADEFHLISTFYQSGFDRFTTDFRNLRHLISEIQMKTVATDIIKNEYFRRHMESMLSDLEYLLKNIHYLENSHDPKSSEELLHELMDAATYPSASDFLSDSANLDVLLRLVFKLKLLVPVAIKQVADLEASRTTREKKLQFSRRKFKERDATDVDTEDSETMENLLSFYRSLNDIQRKCLLCFSVFSLSEGRHENQMLVIKKRMLIQWWAGEGFLMKKKFRKLLHVVFCARGWVGEGSDLWRAFCVKTGKEVLYTLEKKKFIKTVNKGRDSGSCCMSPSVLSFVMEEAKKEWFTDFGQVGKLEQCQRVCLLKSRDSFPSSCKLWEDYASSFKRLECLSTTRALLNVNEPIIHIGAEWFSKMKNLLVLHLGTWGFHSEDRVEFVDQKFLEELKIMKQLRLLNLQGFSAITKLPDSVCKLSNLIILNLRDCSYLEKLPADIGSLKNLVHLDITQCSSLYMLPEGVKLLSKLEVLKGMVLTFQDGGKQHEKAFTLRGLLKLENLMKLNLIVNKDHFPDSEELQILKEMKKLCNLKITWEKSYFLFEESNISTVTEPSKHSKWQWIKCCGSQGAQNDMEQTSTSNHLDNLKKLVLYCFPTETAPEWLDPSNLRNLEKLYIVGGHLETLPGSDQNTWNVNILRLKYLRKLKILWPALREMFPKIVFLEKHQCDKLTSFPCDDEGVWTKERENEVEEDGEGNTTTDLE